MIAETIPAAAIAYAVAAVVSGAAWYVFLERPSEEASWSKALWSLVVAVAWPVAVIAAILMLLASALAWLGIDIYNDDGM